MSRENVELVRRGFEVFQAGMERGDPGAPFDAGFLAADAEWFTPPGFPGPPVFRGREGFVEFLRIWTEDFEDWSLKLERVIDAGDDRVVALFHHRAIGKGSGVPVELHQGFIYELEGGRVVRMRNYLTFEEALEAAGLSE
jgi:ketosteroid isomerase-like protein